MKLPYARVWNIVVTFGLVPLVARWNCKTSYNNEYAGLFGLLLAASLESLAHRQVWPA